MNTPFSLITKLTANIKILFLIDSLGAFLTAFFLYGILAQFEAIFKMPKQVLYMLSLMACGFSIYSFSCYYFLFGKTSINWRPYLKVILTANSLYCLLSLGLMLYFYQRLAVLDIIYFSIEIVIIIMLVFVEVKVLMR